MFNVTYLIESIFGIGSSEQLGKRLKEYGCTKILYVYDPAMGMLGFAEKVRAVMEAKGIETVDFTGVVSEPTTIMVDEAIKIARDAKVNGVVGFGGGSSMDVAKMVGAMLVNEGCIGDYVGKNKGKPMKSFSPIVLMPTTAGTSAEITRGAVVTDSTTGFKTSAKQRGTLAIIDPQFTAGLPPSATASTGIDMLSHATESFINHKPHWLSDVLDEKAIELIFKYLPRAVKDGSDMEAREQLSFACMMTGYAFGDNGTTMGHAIANRISDKYHYAHGVGCGLGLYVVVRYSVLGNTEKMLRMAKAIGIDVPENPDIAEIGKQVVEAYDNLQKCVGMKTMRKMGLDEAFIEKAIEELPSDYRFKGSPYAPDFKLVNKAVWEAYNM